MTNINVAKDFSENPAGKLDEDGEFSGERFRREFLLPALLKGQTNVNIREVHFAASFLHEAFGKLTDYFSVGYIKQRLCILSDESTDIYAKLIWKYIENPS